MNKDTIRIKRLPGKHYKYLKINNIDSIFAKIGKGKNGIFHKVVNRISTISHKMGKVFRDLYVKELRQKMKKNIRFFRKRIADFMSKCLTCGKMWKC